MSWLQRSYLLLTKSVQRASSLNNKGLTYTSILQVDRGRWGVHDGVALVAFGPLNRVWLDDAAQVNIALKLEMGFKHGSARIWKGASCLRSDGGGCLGDQLPSSSPEEQSAKQSRDTSRSLPGRTKCLTIKQSRKDLPTVSQNQGKDVLQSYFILNKFFATILDFYLEIAKVS